MVVRVDAVEAPGRRIGTEQSARPRCRQIVVMGRLDDGAGPIAQLRDPRVGLERRASGLRMVRVVVTLIVGLVEAKIFAGRHANRDHAGDRAPGRGRF